MRVCLWLESHCIYCDFSLVTEATAFESRLETKKYLIFLACTFFVMNHTAERNVVITRENS